MRFMRHILVTSACCLAFPVLVFSASAEEVPGRRSIPAWEPDSYGPTPYPHEVHAFLTHEIGYLLRRQNPDGSKG